MYSRILAINSVYCLLCVIILHVCKMVCQTAQIERNDNNKRAAVAAAITNSKDILWHRHKFVCVRDSTAIPTYMRNKHVTNNCTWTMARCSYNLRCTQCALATPHSCILAIEKKMDIIVSSKTVFTVYVQRMFVHVIKISPKRHSAKDRREPNIVSLLRCSSFLASISAPKCNNLII